MDLCVHKDNQIELCENFILENEVNWSEKINWRPTVSLFHQILFIHQIYLLALLATGLWCIQCCALSTTVNLDILSVIQNQSWVKQKLTLPQTV